MYPIKIFIILKLPAYKAGHRREFLQEGVCNSFLATTPLAFIPSTGRGILRDFVKSKICQSYLYD